MSKRFIPHKKYKGVFIPVSIVSYPGLPPLAKILYGTLCLYSGRNGACYPSQARLARDLGVTARHINTLLGKLEKAGFIERESPEGNRAEYYNYDDHAPNAITTRYYFIEHPILAGSLRKKE
jgi:hypothetical protein